MLCYVHIGLFLERANPVVNPVVASQKYLDLVPNESIFDFPFSELSLFLILVIVLSGSISCEM